jgi:hypothetical protein
MAAGSGRSIFNRVGIGPTILIASLQFVTPSHAQIQRDIDRGQGNRRAGVANPQLHGIKAVPIGEADGGFRGGFNRAGQRPEPRARSFAARMRWPVHHGGVSGKVQLAAVNVPLK